MNFIGWQTPGLFEGQRVELMAGEVVQKSPHGDDHALAIMLANDALIRAFGRGFVVRVQLPLIAGSHSEPEPDLAVVSGIPRDIRKHPASALLVVEIGDRTIRHDLGSKAGLFASCQVPDYWVVDLAGRRLVVHRNPVLDTHAKFGFRYSDVRSHPASASISPLARPDAPIAVSDLLP